MNYCLKINELYIKIKNNSIYQVIPYCISNMIFNFSIN